MNGSPTDLADRYNAAISAYLVDRSEALLSNANELGRQAIGDGCGLLDIETIHANALLAILAGAPESERAELAGAAQAFFQELLAPFEMSFRGYREANLRLQQLNDALVRQRDEVAFANRELEAFSYSLAHDLRAPLRSIDGFSEAVLEEDAAVLSDKGKAYLAIVRGSVRDMSRLIDAMLELAKVGHGEVLRVRVDLTAVARKIADRLRATYPTRRVELVIHDGLTANCDPRLLGGVLENLIGNAWKFTSKRDEARIEVGWSAEASAYFVRDNGAGFDMKHASRLFDAFERLHSPRDFEGTGIGLATARRIIHRHHGRIWAEGEVGVGATFYFTVGDEPADP